MAFFTQEMKKAREPRIKDICKQYGVKASCSVHNRSTFVLKIKSGPIDFFTNYNETVEENYPHLGKPSLDSNMRVNEFHYKTHFTGVSLEFLKKVIDIMFEGNWDKSDIMTDYFNVGWYLDVSIGDWNKPYELI